MVSQFLAALSAIAPPVGGAAYAFADEDRSCRGWVQFIVKSDSSVVIHRLWTLKPGKGNGSYMLGKVCELADLHGVEIILKALPFGRKPHPMAADSLVEWYQRHGFVGTRKKLVRKPVAVPATIAAAPR